MKKKEVVDLKAREAIMQVANALYGTMFSQVFIKQLADQLFENQLKKKEPHDKGL